MKVLKSRGFIATLCIMSVVLIGKPVKAASTNGFPLGNVKATEPEVLILDKNFNDNNIVSPGYRKKSNNSVDGFKGVNLPEKYDSRDYGRITSVKDQGVNNCCWSFPLIAALESSLISSGQFQNDIDLSEAHLIKYSCTSVEDPLGGTRGDSVRCVSDDIYNQENNVQKAYHVLANWIGATQESYMEYPENSSTWKNVSQEEAYYHDIAHLQGMYQLDYSDKELVKSAIMKYGALFCGCYMYQCFLNYQNGAYYIPVFPDDNNHAILIVGWDDNYSHENFTYDPGMDGAWLVKNSWGKEFCNDGYFWISYNDKALGADGMCYVLVGEKADNYDLNYQYDGSYMDCYINVLDGAKASNIFKVDANSNRKQILKAVSFAIGSKETDYEIQIYKNPKDVANPESGDVMLNNPVTGFVEYAGYHTIKLPEEVVLYPGDTFAAVITFHSSETINVIAETTETRGGIEYIAAAEPHTSMIMLSPSDNWRDIGEQYNRNLRIKAFTCFSDEVDSTTKRIPFKDVSESDWEYTYVCDVYEKSIMVGLSNDEFGKNRNLTRAEFVTVLYSMSGRPQVDYEEVFTDISAGKWYSIPVVWAKKNGITAGYGERFGVADKITREQLVRMLYSFSGDAQKDTKPNIDNLCKFADSDKISSWAKEAVAWSIENNVIAGKPLEPGKLFMDPKGYATRGECATIISQYLKSGSRMR